MSPRLAVFVDRDGVIDALAPDPVTGMPEAPFRVEDVALLPGVADALRSLSNAGFALVCVTNQPAAAKRFTSVEALEEVHSRVLELLENEGVRFDAWRMCLHHPEGTDPALSGLCDCRKPAPGMLIDAANELGVDFEGSWMIGDTDSDIAAGATVRCRTVLVLHGPSGHRRSGSVVPEFVVDNLPEAASVVLREAIDC